MRAVIGTCVSILMVIATVGTVLPSDDGTTSDRVDADKRIADATGKFNETALKPSCCCCDIADMTVFGSKHLAYVDTPEFAEAVRMVACGSSKYSPTRIPIPYAWGVFSKGFNRHLAIHRDEEFATTPSSTPLDPHTGGGGLSMLKDKECLIPVLIFLASLEYRSWPGHERQSPVFPRIVRTATAELDARFSEKCRMAEAFGSRAAAILAMIAEAERLSPGSCSPDELARAKSELAQARRRALGVRFSLQETEAAFARAEKVVAGMLGR